MSDTMSEWAAHERAQRRYSTMTLSQLKARLKEAIKHKGTRDDDSGMIKSAIIYREDINNQLDKEFKAEPNILIVQIGNKPVKTFFNTGEGREAAEDYEIELNEAFARISQMTGGVYVAPTVDIYNHKIQK